jgi:hypothetical protein
MSEQTEKNDEDLSRVVSFPRERGWGIYRANPRGESMDWLSFAVGVAIGAGVVNATWAMVCRRR